MRTKVNFPIRSRGFARKRGAMLSWGLLITLACLIPPSAPAQFPQSSQGSTTQSGGRPILSPDSHEAGLNRPDIYPPLTLQQKQGLVQANFAKSKSDAAALAALAKELREELNKPDAVLSAEVINRVEKIEKLAKRIRDETKGY